MHTQKLTNTTAAATTTSTTAAVSSSDDKSSLTASATAAASTAAAVPPKKNNDTQLMDPLTRRALVEVRKTSTPEALRLKAELEEKEKLLARLKAQYDAAVDNEDKISAALKSFSALEVNEEDQFISDLKALGAPLEIPSFPPFKIKVTRKNSDGEKDVRLSMLPDNSNAAPTQSSTQLVTISPSIIDEKQAPDYLQKLQTALQPSDAKKDEEKEITERREFVKNFMKALIEDKRLEYQRNHIIERYNWLPEGKQFFLMIPDDEPQKAYSLIRGDEKYSSTSLKSISTASLKNYISTFQNNATEYKALDEAFPDETIDPSQTRTDAKNKRDFILEVSDIANSLPYEMALHTLNIKKFICCCCRNKPFSTDQRSAPHHMRNVLPSPIMDIVNQLHTFWMPLFFATVALSLTIITSLLIRHIPITLTLDGENNLFDSTNSSLFTAITSTATVVGALVTVGLFKTAHTLYKSNWTKTVFVQPEDKLDHTNDYADIEEQIQCKYGN